MSRKDEKLYGVVDPNWGDPFVIPETLANTPEQAVDKAIRTPGLISSLYGLHGWNWMVDEQGYRVARVQISIAEKVEYRDEEDTSAR